MKYTSIIYGIPLIYLLFVGCSRENFLDIKPKGEVVPSTVEDYRQMLDQVNVDPHNDRPQVSLGFGQKNANISIQMSDNQLIPGELVAGFSSFQLRAYMFLEHYFSEIENDVQWDIYYNHIYVANVILDGLERVENAANDRVEELRAEARLHRAYAYFNLVNLYALHYNPSSAETDLGVPIREGIELNQVSLVRSSVQDVYDYILEDINQSIDALDPIQEPRYNFRPSQAGAYGLLAKVYLYQAKYELALDAASKALALYNDLRDINLDPSPFPILRLKPIVIEDPEIIWYKAYHNSFASYNNIIIASPELLQLYSENDARRFWFAPIELLIGFEVDAFAYATVLETENYADGIHTPDLLLIHAECNARLGNLNASLESLNALRQNRMISGTFEPLSFQEPQNLLRFIKEERRREMAQSTERIFDIKRYNVFDNDQISVTHQLGEMTSSLLPNSNNWAIPIAQKYIQLNPEIVQNPRD